MFETFQRTLYYYNVYDTTSNLTLKVLVTTIDALQHFEIG